MRQAIPLHAAQAPRGFEPRQAKELEPVFRLYLTGAVKVREASRVPQKPLTLLNSPFTLEMLMWRTLNCAEEWAVAAVRMSFAEASRRVPLCGYPTQRVLLPSSFGQLRSTGEARDTPS